MGFLAAAPSGFPAKGGKMAEFVVVTVRFAEAPSAEEARADAYDSESRYEGEFAIAVLPVATEA